MTRDHYRVPPRRVDPPGLDRWRLLGCAIVWLAAVITLTVFVIGWDLATSRPGPDVSPRPTQPGTPPAEAGTRGPGALPATPQDGGDGTGGAPRYRGLATWYCLSGSSTCTRGYRDSDLVAAIDTDLGFGKGDRLLIRHGERSVVVEVVDVCGCPGDRLIDLTHGAFRRLANPDLGWIPVTLEAAGARPTLPATETAP